MFDLDSICVYQFISQRVRGTHVHAYIVNTVKNLMEDFDDNIVVKRVYREGHFCADG